MSIEKSAKELKAAAFYAASLYPDKQKWPKPAKYRRDSALDLDVEPEIYPGMTVVIEMRRKENNFYVRAVIVDYVAHEGIWSNRTDVICHVVGVSQPAEDELVGHLICARAMGRGYFGGSVRIIDFDASNWEKYLPSGSP